MEPNVHLGSHLLHHKFLTAPRPARTIFLLDPEVYQMRLQALKAVHKFHETIKRALHLSMVVVLTGRRVVMYGLIGKRKTILLVTKSLSAGDIPKRKLSLKNNTWIKNGGG